VFGEWIVAARVQSRNKRPCDGYKGTTNVMPALYKLPIYVGRCGRKRTISACSRL